jgi:selT/selW/selH-like putative selenoprotein
MDAQSRIRKWEVPTTYGCLFTAYIGTTSLSLGIITFGYPERVLLCFMYSCSISSTNTENNPQFAQELLSTFQDSIKEVALQPVTGGIFTVDITYNNLFTNSVTTTSLWDRKSKGGFPETKELKRLVRDCVEPNRDLGHVDRHKKSEPAATQLLTAQVVEHAPAMNSESVQSTDHVKRNPDGSICEDCD